MTGSTDRWGGGADDRYPMSPAGAEEAAAGAGSDAGSGVGRWTAAVAPATGRQTEDARAPGPRAATDRAPDEGTAADEPAADDDVRRVDDVRGIDVRGIDDVRRVDDERAGDSDRPPDAGTDGPASTGHPQVDDALAGLAAVTDRPPAEQIGAYEAAHEALRNTLSSIEES